MAVRDFAGGTGNKITLYPGRVGALFNGAFTIVGMANFDNFAADPSLIIGFNTTGTFWAEFGMRSNQREQYRTQPGNVNGTTNNGNTGGDWFMHVVTKTSGTTTPRFHWKNIQTNSAWAHAVGDASSANQTSPVSAILIGSNTVNMDGKMALAAVFDYSMTDAQVESITATLSTIDLFNISSSGADPIAAWEFNQPSIRRIYDITGGGANQQDATGQAIVTGDDPPNWNFLSAGGSVLVPTFDPTGVLG